MSKKPSATVLFVDDDEDFVYALSKLLEGEGYRVRHAPDGDAAVRMATEEPPDLIILDFMMPVKNGFEALLELRAIDATADVPILALTSFGQDIGRIHGLGQSDEQPLVQDCLEKPVEPNVLLDRVASVMTARGAGSSLEHFKL